MIKEAIEYIKTLALQGIDPKIVEGANIPFVMTPPSYTARAMPELIHNDYAARPHRIKQAVTVLDPGSFIEYYGKFADSNSRVFGDEEGLKVKGILDYHVPTADPDGSTPRWGSHTVTLTLRPSEEWRRWSAQDGKKMTQAEFAEFLEQNSVDIVRPSPAHMMEIATDLKGTTEVEFANGIRQQDGSVKFKYTEQTKTTVGAGEVNVPDRFVLSVPVFIGSERIHLEAYLRFRVNGGKLQFWFTLIRPEAAIRTAFQASSVKIASDLKIVIIAGSPA